MSKRKVEDYSYLTETPTEDDKKKKRKSRWGSSDKEKVIIPGLPTTLPPNLTPEQEKMYLLQLQIEEITRRLRSGDLGIPLNPGDRSPSPEPVYNNEGKRTNTREVRVRKKLEDERHAQIQKLILLNPDYKPPIDYKPPQIRYNDKVFIPQDEHPQLNFVGLLIGPRGNTLRQLEKETGAKIIIRGKGSVKEGKLGGRKDGMPLPGEDEPLHAWITAPTEEIVAKAKSRISEIIKQGIETPDDENDLRKQQLRELALINGTLKENDGLVKLRLIAEAGTIATNNIICGMCGGTGHLAIDCKANRDASYYTPMSLSGPALLALENGDVLPPGVSATPEPIVGPSGVPYTGGNQLATFYGGGGMGGISSADRMKMDSEYSALMAELGVKNSDLAGVGCMGSNKYIDKTMSRAPPFRAPAPIPLRPFGSSIPDHNTYTPPIPPSHNSSHHYNYSNPGPPPGGPGYFGSQTGSGNYGGGNSIYGMPPRPPALHGSGPPPPPPRGPSLYPTPSGNYNSVTGRFPPPPPPLPTGSSHLPWASGSIPSLPPAPPIAGVRPPPPPPPSHWPPPPPMPPST